LVVRLPFTIVSTTTRAPEDARVEVSFLDPYLEATILE